MGKPRKIPTNFELKAKRMEQLAKREEEENKQIMAFLQDNALKMYFHFSLGMEALEVIKETTEFQKGLKLHGNRFLKELEKYILPKIDKLYPLQPEYTTNMMRSMDQVGAKWAKAMFADYPFLDEMIDDFNKDPEDWRDILRARMRKLDSQIEE